MIERIASAEAEAAKIKKDAAAKGREDIAAAAARAAGEIEGAKENARVAADRARVGAEEEGARLSEGIMAERKAAADAACAKARLNLDRAAGLIVGRIVGT
jgi:hypothetical protein